MKKNYIIGTHIFLTLLIATLFMAFENVIGLRRLELIGLFGVLSALPLIRLKMKAELAVWINIIDIILLFIISNLSRYVINYYVYALYMMVLVEIGLLFELKLGKYLMGLVVFATVYHYGVLYTYRSNWGTVSEIFFMLLINVVIVLGVIMVKVFNQEKEKQRELNLALQETNEKLEKLTRLEVKTNIARDIHDTFGHDMMALIMEIEMADVLVEKSPIEAREMLKQAKVSARNGMKTIRKVVETLRNETVDIISETLDELIDNYTSRTGIDTHVEIEPEIYDVPKRVHDVLYRLIQECMTNSIRHGEATVIDIYMSKRGSTINFRVYDNGKGSESIDEGYGLKGMRERITALNGNVRFKSADGFEVKGYIEVPND